MGAVTAKIMGAVERHLGPNANDELFAKAMTRICDGYPPDCSQHFTCMHGGDCFRRNPNRDAARIIEAVAEKQEGSVRACLMAAAHAIRAGEKGHSANVLPFPGGHP